MWPSGSWPGSPRGRTERRTDRFPLPDTYGTGGAIRSPSAFTVTDDPAFAPALAPTLALASHEVTYMWSIFRFAMNVRAISRPCPVKCPLPG